MAKPVLYVDVDDVLIAECHRGSGFDMRPRVMTQLFVLTRLFKCVWLTCWTRERIFELMRFLYGAHINRRMTYAVWSEFHPHRKAGYVLAPGKPEDFYWLEDPLCLNELKALEDDNKLDRYIRVEPTGEWGLTDAINDLFKRAGITDTQIKAVGGNPEWFIKPSTELNKEMTCSKRNL